jgi:DNA-binding response OmpR family regulator
MTSRILIIDDEEHIRRMMRLTLEAAGYEVGEAREGLEGLKLYGDGSAWDGVVLDQRMPGMDGLEVLQRIREVRHGAGVVMATAYASIELAVDAMKLGASDFVRKPMTPETLRNAVAAMLAKPPEEFAAAKIPAPAPGDKPSPTEIETITMNGFTILDPEQSQWGLPDQRRFTVVSPAGTEHEVLVEIDEGALGYVERLTGRRLPPGSSFWTSQARRLLSDFLWNKGEVPRTRKLVLREIGRDELLVAERWNDN